MPVSTDQQNSNNNNNFPTRRARRNTNQSIPNAPPTRRLADLETCAVTAYFLFRKHIANALLLVSNGGLAQSKRPDCDCDCERVVLESHCSNHSKTLLLHSTIDRQSKARGQNYDCQGVWLSLSIKLWQSLYVRRPRPARGTCSHEPSVGSVKGKGELGRGRNNVKPTRATTAH
jgi:hypothetical protein